MKASVTEKEFMKIFSPVLGWVANNKNKFYDQINYTIKKDHGDGDMSLDLTFFLDKKPEHWSHKNTFVMVYQTRGVETLLKIKAHIKAILKAKTVEEFEAIDREIESL
jgi:hypothetical protein